MSDNGGTDWEDFNNDDATPEEFEEALANDVAADPDGDWQP